MANRRNFVKQLGLMAGAFSANSLFNQAHAAQFEHINLLKQDVSAKDLAMDEDYSEALNVLEERRVMTVIDPLSAKGIPAKVAQADEDENVQEAPARFVTHPWVWGAMRQYSPLVPWGSIVFSTRAFSKELYSLTPCRNISQVEGSTKNLLRRTLSPN
jgi:hypothetical protein